jgi:hypothetical protein
LLSEQGRKNSDQDLLNAFWPLQLSEHADETPCRCHMQPTRRRQHKREDTLDKATP